MAKLSFFGATGTSTGSKTLLEVEDKKLLIDCGLFQGHKENRKKNWERFPIPPEDVDAVLLTHAHIDHSGYLPRFSRDGFSGPIKCTHATADLCQILLRDSAHLQEEDAHWANKKGYSKHKPALPLYTIEDAESALGQFEAVHYDHNLRLSDTLRVKFRDAGHILGSALVDVRTTRDKRNAKILFSGDLGRPCRPILKEPSQAYNVDYLVVESTYGDRLHAKGSPSEALARVINESVERGGVLLIPAFAVGRTQAILYRIRELEEDGAIPTMPVFLDSPMAIDATEIFANHIPEQNLTSRVLTIEGTQLFRPKRLNICDTRDESKAINQQDRRAIIVSASGMVTGGRVLHHMRQRLPDARNTILFMGYQAGGTRGRKLVDGMPEVKIHGDQVNVKAKIESLSGFSGHADYNEILAWMMGFNRPPKKTFIVHGEDEASASLADKIRTRFRWDVEIPKVGGSFELDL